MLSHSQMTIILLGTSWFLNFRDNYNASGVHILVVRYKARMNQNV